MRKVGLVAILVFFSYNTQVQAILAVFLISSGNKHTNMKMNNSHILAAEVLFIYFFFVFIF